MVGSQFFKALGIANQTDLNRVSKQTGIPRDRLKFYNDGDIVPSGNDLESIQKFFPVTQLELKLMMGRLDRQVIRAIQEKSTTVANLLERNSEIKKALKPKKVFNTKLGTLYEGDCVNLMKTIDNDSVDLIFADPPFNLNKLYPSKMDDNLKEFEYLNWTEEWLAECVRILRPGGSFFVWNLPKWNTYVATYLNGRLKFRHWIAVDIKYRLPIQGRLYPSHYALLYYCKGERPNTFRPDRLPMEVCPHCAEDLRDYGGYKDKMNPKGVNMADVWYDIPPVRHAKYKRRENSNELSLKLLDRIVEMASNEGDVVFDPFGGSGTTYVAAELKKRKWIGSEVGPTKEIIRRFRRVGEEREFLDTFRKDYNTLFTHSIAKVRLKRKLWTPETLGQKKAPKEQLSLI